MVAVPRLLIFSKLVASFTATDMGEKNHNKFNLDSYKFNFHFSVLSQLIVYLLLYSSQT